MALVGTLVTRKCKLIINLPGAGSWTLGRLQLEGLLAAGPWLGQLFSFSSLSVSMESLSHMLSPPFPVLDISFYFFLKVQTQGIRMSLSAGACLGWQGSRVDGLQAHPVMGDWSMLLASFSDPETDVTCTTTLAIQLNMGVRGAGEEGGQKGQVLLANGMPHRIIIPQESCPFRKGEPNRPGDRTSTQPDPCPGLAALLPAGLGGDGASGLGRPRKRQKSSTSCLLELTVPGTGTSPSLWVLCLRL